MRPFKATVKPEEVWATIKRAMNGGYITFTFTVNKDGTVNITGDGIQV